MLDVRLNIKGDHSEPDSTKEMISLFSGGGIGDLGFYAAGFNVKIANELIPQRAALFKHNFKQTKMFVGDIWKKKEEILVYTKNNNIKPFLIFATPPCQGMSSNGAGKLLREYREGNRPKFDPRNRLIIPALHIIKELNPDWIIFENVCGMQNTVIEDEDGEIRNIISVIKNNIGNEYIGYAKELEFADYGLPQMRKRLITIYTKNIIAKKVHDLGYDLFPVTTHNQFGINGKMKWTSLRSAIGNFKKLDAKEKFSSCDVNDILHHVSVIDPIKYEWIKNTPEGKSAFDNQCINPLCGYDKNTNHGMKKENGINQAKKDTPIYCLKCGSLLPRPYVEENGIKRIMKGYTSAYKRMTWDQPASTITTNFNFSCSDRKIHPTENRTLSISEACVLQSISNYNYSWGPLMMNGKYYKKANDTLIRDIIGESVPPIITEKIGNYIKTISEENNLDIFKNKKKGQTLVSFLNR